MLIRVPKGWETSEREVTPEEFYHSRRRFLAGAAVGLGAFGLSAFGLSRALDPFAEEPAGLANRPF